MRKSDSFSRRAGDFLAGRGFYIVLILCIGVIGASTWAMLSNSGSDFQVEDIPAMGGASEISVQPPVVPTFGTGERETPRPTPSPSPTPQDEDTFFGLGGREEEEEPTETPPVPQEVSPPAETQPPAPAELRFVWPVLGEVAMYHVVDSLIFDRTMGDFRTHAGIDIRAELGETVLAMADGVVSRVFMDDLLGRVLVIDHGNGMESLYANLMEAPLVEEGQFVTMGMPIGAVGSTALAKSGIVHHLHLEVIIDGVQHDPLDFLPAR